MRLWLWLLAAVAVVAPAQDFEVLPVTGTAGIPLQPGEQAIDFDAGAQGYYFLVKTESGGAAILRSSAEGAETGRMALPEPAEGGEAKLLRLDSNGGAGVLVTGSFANLLYVDSSGVHKQLTIMRPVGDMAFLGTELAVVDSTSSELIWPDSDRGEILLSPPVSGKVILFPVGPDSLAILEASALRLRVVTRDLTIYSAAALKAPELEDSGREGDGSEPVIGTAAATADGRVFALVTGHTAPEGAILLEFDLKANLLASYRLPLAEGTVPSKLAVYGDTLVVASFPAKSLTLFAVPPPPRRRRR